jgi:NADH-quinone oxidoreductase subunit L
MMVFFGEARWKDAGDDHEAHGEFKPHESPVIMLIPLVVLAGLATLGGIINLPALFGIPSGGTHRLEDWLHPVIAFGEAEIDGTFAYDNKYLLVAIAVGCAVAGIVLGWLVYLKKRVEPFEPVILARGWYYDAAISWFMGNPGREVAQGVADFDATVVDGAVTGVATVVRETATETRKAQTGYVRQYAAIIGVGVVLLLSWFVVIRGIL